MSLESTINDMSSPTIENEKKGFLAELCDLERISGQLSHTMCLPTCLELKNIICSKGWAMLGRVDGKTLHM